jgi:hypothetical protein
MIRIIDATALSLMATGALAQATINFDATQSAVFKDEAGTMCTKLRMKRGAGDGPSFFASCALGGALQT